MFGLIVLTVVLLILILIYMTVGGDPQIQEPCVKVVEAAIEPEPQPITIAEIIANAERPTIKPKKKKSNWVKPQKKVSVPKPLIK